MNTPRALLIPALLTLAACGGGGGDATPSLPAAPVVQIWTGTATAGELPSPGRSTRSATMRPSPAHQTPYPARGTECVQGVWTQTVTRPGEIRLQARAESFAVQPNGGPRTVFATATAAGTIEIPFRFCSNFEDRFGGTKSATLSINVQGLTGNILAEWTASARWTVEGSRL